MYGVLCLFCSPYNIHMRRLVLFILVASRLFGAKILFDFTKDEDAGNADWVIDDNWPIPYPNWPTSPTDWNGAISSWGYQLKMQYGDTVHTLYGYPITYGDNSNPYDLSNYDVFIVPEPQDTFTVSERNAILNFVANGGGLFIVADHYASDRNNNGWDSPRIWNRFGTEEYFGFHFQVAGESYNSVTETSSTLNYSSDLYDIIHGPEGDVSSLAFHAGDVMRINTAYNSNVKVVVYYPGTSYGMCVVSGYGRGRVAAIGDSSPCDDGTARPGNDNIYNGWGEATDSILFLNLTRWLVPVSSVKEGKVQFEFETRKDYGQKVVFDILGRRHKNRVFRRGFYFIKKVKGRKNIILRLQ